jgi:hypothetical protein
MQIIFDAISITNETPFVPSTSGGECECVDAIGGTDNIEGWEEEQPPHHPKCQTQFWKKASYHFPQGKEEKTFIDQCMKHLVDAYEKKAKSSNNYATSKVVDSVREEIGNMLDQVIKDGAEEGSDEPYYVTQLLIKKEYHDVFITLKTSNGRLNWLMRAWADSKKQ